MKVTGDLKNKPPEFMKLHFIKADFKCSSRTEKDSVHAFVNLIFENARLSIEDQSIIETPNAFYVNDNKQWMQDCKAIWCYFPLWTSTMQSGNNIIMNMPILFA